MRATWLLALLALAACSKGGAANNAANVAAVPTNAPPVNAIAVADFYGTQSSPQLAKIFTPDILGANLAYLETLTGPAFSTDGAERVYKVDGCKLIVGVGKGKIANIGIDGVSGHCSFPIMQYFAGGYAQPVPRTPTFGDIKNTFGGHYDADCLTQCGNAADPVVSLAYSGSHADNFNGLYAAISITDDPALSAYMDWGAKLTAKYGQDYVVARKFSQGDNLDDVASKDFGPVRPTIVRVGQELPGGADD
jgi:hypothetical protein